MRDAVTMALLYDYYGGLLTEKQRTCFDLYYNQDYSLAEIAAEAGISRQGVHETIARAEALLRRFEAQIGCLAREAQVQQAARAIEAAARKLLAGGEAPALAGEILRAVETIKE